MDRLKELSLRTYDMPNINQTIFWDTFGRDVSPKYRSISVNNTFDPMKVTSIPIENVSGVKEFGNISNLNTGNNLRAATRSLKEFETISDLDKYNTFCKTTKSVKDLETTSNLNRSYASFKATKSLKEFEHINNLNRSNSFHASAKSDANPSILSGTCKRIPYIDSPKHVNAIHDQGDSEHALLDRLKQGSWSEPSLPIAKDRGDSVAFQDVYLGKGALQDIYNRCIDARKSMLPNVKGYLYIKNAGNIYKSVIEAKKLQADERDIFRNHFPRFKQLFRASTSKSMLGKNDFQFQTEDMGDFEIAIYLSGLSTDGKLPKQKMTDIGRTQRGESKVRHDRVKKKKKSFINKNNVPFGKSYETVNQVHTSSSKMQRPKQIDTDRHSHCDTRLTFEVKKSKNEFDFLDDDSGAEYVLNESGTIVAKGESKDISASNSSNVRNNDSERLACESRKTASVSSRSKLVSQSTIYSDLYGVSKPKISEEELWETFEMIFKNYASTSRHSGEVIPRKISTEWMKNAGLVNEIMTQKEADDAFRSVAGTKITMNAQEYKDFLINLSLKMKLPYYEIYRRMCGM